LTHQSLGIAGAFLFWRDTPWSEEELEEKQSAKEDEGEER
jgi:hypothetical protein